MSVGMNESSLGSGKQPQQQLKIDQAKQRYFPDDDFREAYVSRATMNTVYSCVYQ